MPGILPMKVIKVGNTSQSRIAQACDRCRSKKIRCDGIRPCCSQCSSVGFECKTSDKLSRRAFPRGYTESLEERVRSLESEVRELKDLLDEKDEKIEVLSRIHSFTAPSSKARSSSTAVVPGSASPSNTQRSEKSDEEGVVHVQHSSSLASKPTSHSPFTGPSSVRALSSALTTKLSGNGTPLSSISTKYLTSFPPRTFQPTNHTPGLPPRLVSDLLISIYFQEWAPLYPVVHRPVILKAYDDYVTKPKLLQNQPHILTQLNLIFGIAALSARSRTSQDPVLFEQNWYPALEALSSDVSLPAMQCLVLAQIYCLVKGDYQTLSRYRGLAVGMAQSLGLHQSQARFALDPLTTETRKKVFWCQFVLDRFAAAATGLPILLREKDVDTEIPTDVDDENVTETGFIPAVPEEPTRLSSALALLEASKILGKALELLYPSSANYEIPLSKLRNLSEELDSWHNSLPRHLKLVFAQDKPSTNVTGSRSPLLSLVYYFTRILIHRPAACFGSSTIASSSTLAMSDASKHIIQILDLLDERGLCLSLALNRLEVAYLSGLCLLWQNLGLKRDSRLAKDTHKTLSAVRKQIEPASMAAATEFRVLSSVVTGTRSDKHPPSPLEAQGLSSKKALQSLQSRLSLTSKAKNVKVEPVSRRNTITGASSSQASQQPEVCHQVRGVPHQSTYTPSGKHRTLESSAEVPMNYYTVHADAGRTMSCTDVSSVPLSAADWELILGDLDRGQANIFNGIYGGQECGEPSPFDSVASGYFGYSTSYPASGSIRPASQDLSPKTWSPSSGDLSHTYDTSQSVQSHSEDGLGSTEDLLITNNIPIAHDGNYNMINPLKGIVIPSVDDDFIDLGLFDTWEHQLTTA